MGAQRKTPAVAGRGQDRVELLSRLYRHGDFTARRPLAPFGAGVRAAVEAGENPNVFLFCGPGAWGRAKLRREQHGAASALVLPVGADPGSLTWPPVGEVVVDAQDLEGCQREALARALMRDGVRFACVIFDGGAINVRASWSKQVSA